MILGRQAIRVWRAGATTEDDYHNQIPGAGSSHDVTGCSVQPGPGTEYLVDRSSTTTIWTAWVPLAADVTDDDEVEYPIGSGKRYEVDGAVERWETGTPLDHLVVRLKRSQG